MTAAQQFEQGGFSGAGSSDDAQHFPRIQGKRYPFERCALSELDRYVRHAQKGLRHFKFLLLRDRLTAPGIESGALHPLKSRYFFGNGERIATAPGDGWILSGFGYPHGDPSSRTVTILQFGSLIGSAGQRRPQISLLRRIDCSATETTMIKP